MKHIVCYSGGETSGLVAIEVVRRYGAANTILVNHNITKRVEDPDIQRFKDEVADYLGLPITYVNMDGWEDKDQFDVCMEAKAFKVGIHPLCTNRIKTAPFHKWLKETFPVGPESGRNNEIVIYYGFEKGEGQRVKRRREILGKMGYKTGFPLAEWEMSLQTTLDVGIVPPKTYEIWKHANCTGCLRAGRQHWYVVYCRRPDVFEKAKYAESVIGYSILKGIYLHELEPRFEAMREVGIKADEKMHAATFWAKVRRLLDTEDEQSCGGCQGEDQEVVEQLSLALGEWTA